MTDLLEGRADALTHLKLLFDISRELAAALDLRTVLQRVLYLSASSVKSNSGSIIVLNEDGKPINSAIIHGNNLYEETTQRLKATLENGLAGWVMRNRTAALVSDTSKDERWIKRNYASGQETGPKSSVSAPLMVRDKLVGVMTLTHPEPDHFTQEHLNLIQAISDQAAVAVLNGQLYSESQQRANVMSALAESAVSISSSLDLDNVLQRILNQTVKALQVDAVSLALIDPYTKELEFRAATGSSSGKLVGLRIQIGQGIVGWVAREEQALIVPDVSKDPRFYKGVDEITGYTTKSIIAAPITAQGVVIGVLAALNPDKPFNAGDLTVLKGISSLAGTAIDHARLFNEVDQAHRRYRQLFEDNVDPIFVTDWEGRISEVNLRATHLTGFPEQSLLKMNIHHFHQLDLSAVGEDFSKLTEDQTITYESSVYRRQGDEIPVEVYVRKVVIGENDRLQWLVRDITERKNIDKMREDLVSMIYHDLRSPLSNVVSGLELLVQMLPTEDPNIHSIIAIALRSTERVQNLAKSLLDTSRLEAGQQIGEPIATDLHVIIQDATDAILPLYKSRKQTLNINMPPLLPKILANSDMIKRVVINLLENASKYSLENTPVELKVQAVEGWLQVSVTDQGRGISAEDQKTIFDKYTRARTGSTGHTKGLGLGLAFCKLAIEGHGGKIWIESELNQGASFIFTLPTVK